MTRQIAFVLPRTSLVLLAALCGVLFPVLSARSAETDRIEAFLEITGFDAALDSIALSASSAPEMLGIDPGSFGSEWTRISEEVFDTKVMRGLALDILGATLRDDMLNHAAEFYATDLGQRLVATENESHLSDDDVADRAEGDEIVADLRDSDPGRLELLDRMNRAIDADGNSLRALQEIQVRFLMAASAAGIIEMRIDADGLRALMRAQADEMRAELRASALAGSAQTYQDFSNEELTTYAEALENPVMQEVYSLLNAVQFEIMANRFEVLAARMKGMKPGQDI